MRNELAALVATLRASSDPECLEAAEELEKLAEELAGKAERIEELEDIVGKLQEGIGLISRWKRKRP